MDFTPIKDDRGFMVYNWKTLTKSLFLTALVVSSTTFAQSVEVPEDELARESVLPRFDNSVSVKNRNVTKEGRVDVGLFGGMALTEPIANTTKFGVEVNYHINEIHSIGGLFNINSTGLSRDAKGLKNDFELDFNRAPQPKNTMMLNYDYTPFYGKLSLTKDGVINTTIYGSAGLGVVKYQHKTYPALALGIGERFYFTKQFSVKLDLKLFAHNAPIPFLKCKLTPVEAGSCPNPGAPVTPPDYSEFEERITYTTNLQLGINYLF